MKKYGKYEKRPVVAPEKKKKVPNVLLQTYLTSLLSLVLCVTMFFGTSYAWFTSEVTNTNNEIHVGILKVGLYREDGTDLSNSTNKLFDGNIRWEPGYTSLETIKIVNEGDLAFKYVLSFTGNEAAAVADSFEVWVYDHYQKAAPNPSAYADISADNGWTSVGTLADVLAGDPVLDGVMVSVREAGQDAAAINEDTVDGLATTDTYTIALHMKDGATSDVMGKNISLNVKLIAYQMASSKETDDLGSSYDDVTAVMEAEELSSALSGGKNTLLLSDIAIDNLDSRLTMTGGVLDGAENTISYSGGKSSGGNSVGVLTTSGGSINNLTITGEENGRALYVTNLASDLSVSNCTLSGAYAFNVNSSKATGNTITFVDTVFNSWVSYANVMDHAYFTNCTFGGALKPYGDTTLTGCTFSNEKLDVSSLAEGETITLVNCTYGSTSGVNAVVKRVDGAVKIEGASFSVNSDGYLVTSAG